ncbi:alanine:cation symporter family protein [Alphaproteobacteria bacterium]|nr:alanine:cation symporter family protein [Alphaproteobacteria bacterium]
MSIDQKINELFGPVSEKLSSVIFCSVSVGDDLSIKLILLWLVAAALFFTTYMGFINIRGFAHALSLVFTKGDDKADGEISRFQALATSLSGTVGLGNIAGVAVAISVGGPGATFWMVLMGFFSMSTKFVEVMLGVKYRHHPDPENPDRIAGGANVLPARRLRQARHDNIWKRHGHLLRPLRRPRNNRRR